MTTSAERDLKKSRDQRRGSFQFTDGKIVAHFTNWDDDANNGDGKYTEIDKVFDTWEAFAKYSAEFFAAEI